MYDIADVGFVVAAGARARGIRDPARAYAVLVSERNERSTEILPLTGLRALAAWWVVLFHFCRGNIHLPLAREVIAAGHVAVDLFFLLSGFVLARRYHPEDVAAWRGRWGFYVRRLARVYPLYVLSLGLGVYAEMPHSLSALHTGRGLLRLVAQLGLLNAWSHLWMFRHNWAAWSLSVEVFFYLVFPWVLPWVMTLRPGRVVLAAAVLALAVPAAYNAIDPDHLGHPLQRGDEVLWSWYVKFFPLQRLPMFVAGVAASRIPEARLPRWSADLVLVGIVGLLVLNVVPYALLQGGALLVPFVALVVGLARDEERASVLGRVLATRPFVALGHASYATYILHVPLFLALERHDPLMDTELTHFLGYAALLVVVSLVAYRFVEQPLRRFLTRSLSSRATLRG